MALWVVDAITVKECDLSSLNGKATNVTSSNVCDGSAQQAECEGGGGECVTVTDGYYVEGAACVAVGAIWLAVWGWRTVNRLQVRTGFLLTNVHVSII